MEYIYDISSHENFENVAESFFVLQAVKCSDVLMDKVSVLNRRTLDLLAAKCYFYYSRAYELTGQLDRIRR